ncbi:hypothetical protein EXE10_12865 [Acinetobacter sp. WCHAc060033]|uniref:hypothetical protein n=1 Tax=Acinetobacter sp. WCHAc060033 TaxID=2518624 RepID=UPI001022F8DA|nr:hypothetical protein [Acinetobacter sp. WCHAc060033]RZG81500.1 hypothetical protein EXE10_12865 [Acinetobacter sp. WCHAc060033]
MINKIDVTDVILKQATLISLYVVCYYSIFYIIKLFPEKCMLLFSSRCWLNYTAIYALFILILFVLFVLYVGKLLKGSVSKNIENEIYVLMFLTYFASFEIVTLIAIMDMDFKNSILVWFNIPIVLLSGYFYSSLKIINFDLKVAGNKNITAVLFLILFLFSLNIFGFIQAKEQAYDMKKTILVK